MSYGLQIRNGNNNLILNGESPGPFCIYSRQSVGVFSSGSGAWKVGYLHVPHDSMVFYPFNDWASGGFHMLDTGPEMYTVMNIPQIEGHYAHFFMIRTNASAVDIVVARPAMNCSWGRGNSYGMGIYGANGQLVYDGGQPILQTTHNLTYNFTQFMAANYNASDDSHPIIWNDIGGANYAMQFPYLGGNSYNLGVLTWAGTNGLRPTPAAAYNWSGMANPGFAIFARITI